MSKELEQKAKAFLKKNNIRNYVEPKGELSVFGGLSTILVDFAKSLQVTDKEIEDWARHDMQNIGVNTPSDQPYLDEYKTIYLSRIEGAKWMQNKLNNHG